MNKRGEREDGRYIIFMTPEEWEMLEGGESSDTVTVPKRLHMRYQTAYNQARMGWGETALQIMRHCDEALADEAFFDRCSTEEKGMIKRDIEKYIEQYEAGQFHALLEKVTEAIKNEGPETVPYYKAW
jgi:hypothetical protein